MAEEISAKEFLEAVGNALLRIIALALFGAIHWMLDKGSEFLVPENFKGAKPWLQDIAFAGFALVYGFILYDMVCIFAPWTKSKRSAVVEVSSEGN
jgi:hypothetical protein